MFVGMRLPMVKRKWRILGRNRELGFRIKGLTFFRWA